MSANRLVESASTSTKILSSSKTGDAERREIRSVLEATIRRLVPFEVAQGKCLLKLGKTMLDCVRERYLGGVNLGRAEEEEEGEGVARVVVPEEELVTETRAILARCQSLPRHDFDSRLLTCVDDQLCNISRTLTRLSVAHRGRRVRIDRNSECCDG